MDENQPEEFVGKRPYTKPTMFSEDMLETKGLACDKTIEDDPDCGTFFGHPDYLNVS